MFSLIREIGPYCLLTWGALAVVGCNGDSDETPVTADVWTIKLGSNLVEDTGYSRVFGHPSGDAVLLGASGEAVPQEPDDLSVPRVQDWRLILARHSPEEPRRDWELVTELEAIPMASFLDQSGDLFVFTMPATDGYIDGDLGLGGSPAPATVRKFSAENGEQLWSTEFEIQRYPRMVLLEGEDLLILRRTASDDGSSASVTRLRGDDGSEMWSMETELRDRSANSLSAGYENDFYLTWEANYQDVWVTRYSADDGEQLWDIKVEEQGESGDGYALSTGGVIVEVGNTESEYRSSSTFQKYDRDSGSETYADLVEYSYGEYPDVTYPIMGDGSFFTLGWLNGDYVFRQHADADGSDRWTSAPLGDLDYARQFSRDESGALITSGVASTGSFIVSAEPGSDELRFTYSLGASTPIDMTGTDQGAFVLTKTELPSDNYYSYYSDQHLVRVRAL